MQGRGFHTKRGASITSRQVTSLAARIKNLMLVILVAALVASLIFGIPAIRFQQNAQTTILKRMTAECSDAQYMLSHLSNTGSSSTYAQLSRIRSSIYAIDALNESYDNMENDKAARLIPNSVFADLYTLIDNYYAQLIASSTNTSAVLVQLGEAMDGLTMRLEQLNGGAK